MPRAPLAAAATFCRRGSSSPQASLRSGTLDPVFSAVWLPKWLIFTDFTPGYPLNRFQCRKCLVLNKNICQVWGSNPSKRGASGPRTCVSARWTTRLSQKFVVFGLEVFRRLGLCNVLRPKTIILAYFLLLTLPKVLYMPLMAQKIQQTQK